MSRCARSSPGRRSSSPHRWPSPCRSCAMRSRRPSRSPSLAATDDDLYIKGPGPAAVTRKTGGHITESFTLAEYSDVAALSISRRLLSGLDELARKVKYRVTFLDHVGTFCRVEGAEVAKAAREIPAFASVEEKEKRVVTLYVPPQDMLFASFNPQKALDAHFLDQIKGGSLRTSRA